MLDENLDLVYFCVYQLIPVTPEGEENIKEIQQLQVEDEENT